MTPTDPAKSTACRRLLLIEDDPSQADGVLDLLGEGRRYSLTHVTTLAGGIDHLLRHGADVVLLDLTLPDSRGLGSVNSVLQAAPETPVIVLTGVADDELATEATRQGVQDYLVKGTFAFETLERILGVALERSRKRRELAEEKSRLEEEARTDPLTRTLNRRGLAEVLTDELERSKREGRRLSGVLVDLDDFKAINDEHGYRVGDTVLVETVRRIQGTLRRTDHLSRIGGDEFLALLPATRQAEARLLAERVRLAIGDSPFRVGAETLSVTASLGLLTVENDSIDELLERGGSTLHLSKRAGKDLVSDSDDEGPDPPAGLDEIARALSTGNLEAVACPVIRLDDEEIVGIELFTRSSVPGFESPFDFLRFVLSNDLVTDLDLRCLATCARARTGIRGGQSVHLNLMPSTLRRVPTGELLEILDVPGDDRRLVIDLSEEQIAGDPGDLLEPAGELRRAGVAIALDDCGWGLEGVEALVLLRPDILKIRPRLLRNARSESGELDRLRRLVELGRALGCSVLVEGVATRSDVQLLRGLGVTLAEGPFWPQAGQVGEPHVAPVP